MNIIHAARIQKTLCFLAIVGLFFLLRRLFFVIFLTFVVSYVVNALVLRLSRRFPYRRFNIVLLFSLMLSLGLLLASLIVPQVADETGGFLKHYLDNNMTDRQEVLHALESSVREARSRPRSTGPQKRTQAASPFAYHPVERAMAPAPRVNRPVLRERMIETAVDAPRDTVAVNTEPVLDHEIRRYLDAGTAILVGRDYAVRFRTSEIYLRLFTGTRDMVADVIPRVIAPFTALINALPLLILESIIALIFSFLILWDLPGIQARIAYALERTEVAAISETARMVSNLGSTLGRAFEAQTFIAVINTALTAAGFWLIGLPAVLFLSSIVFVCSFVPIFGVIISTLPAGLLAFKIGGIGKVLLLVGIILVVHVLEAYVLDPMIYGYHLNIHPVVALVVLVLAQHFFGIWGLLLGIPVVTFFLKSVFPPAPE